MSTGQVVPAGTVMALQPGAHTDLTMTPDGRLRVDTSVTGTFTGASGSITNPGVSGTQGQAVQGISNGVPVGTSVAPVTASDRSITTVVANASTILCASNSTRNAISFQIPAALSGGLWISWTGAAGAGTSGSFFFPAGTALVVLDVSVIGRGQINYFSAAAAAGVVVPVTEG